MANSGRPAALAGIRVLDLSQGIAGPYGTRLLGDFGAEIIKIEPPRSGDESRYYEPLADDAPETERSLLFQFLNWNKRGITLDLKTDSARPLFKKLVESSHILVESFKPGTLAAWGLSFDQLFEWNPNLVITSVTNFGQEGPYADYDADELVLQAMSGIMTISGSQDGEPLKHGLNQAAFCAGLNVAYSTMAAHQVVSVFGGCEHVDLSIWEVLASELVVNQPAYAFRGVIQGRPPAIKDIFSGDPLITAEGYFSMQMGGGAPAEVFADLFGREEFRDPEMRQNRGPRSAELRATVEEILKERPAREWFQKGTELRLLVGMVQTGKDLLDCPQLEARDFFWEVDHPVSGRLKMPGELVKLSKTPASLRMRAPLLGEHTSEVLSGELGLSHADLHKLRTAGVV